MIKKGTTYGSIETLCRRNREAEFVPQHDWQEVSNSIVDDRGEAEVHCEEPNLPVSAVANVLFPVKRRSVHVTTVGVDTSNNELSLLFVDKLPRFWSLFRKVDKDHVCWQPEDDCDHTCLLSAESTTTVRSMLTFHDEYPAPSCSAADSVHLLKLPYVSTVLARGQPTYTIRQDATKPSKHTADQIKRGIALRDFSWAPVNTYHV
jgi:hypothetical protein